MKIILVHNPFQIWKLKTWLSLIIRLVTKSHWNHCAVVVTINEVESVSDYQERYKLRPFMEWLREDEKRQFKIVHINPEKDSNWIIDQVIFASGRYKGYDWIKLANHLTKIKLGFTIFKENENRFVCSEWNEFLLTGKKVNWAVPNDYA